MQIVSYRGMRGGDGGAVYSFPNSGAPVFVNNSFVNNKSASGNSAVYTNSPDGEPTLLYNNIIVAVEGQIAVFCRSFNTTTLPALILNDVYVPQGTKYRGLVPIRQESVAIVLFKPKDCARFTHLSNAKGQ
jgi:hypothetical protein